MDTPEPAVVALKAQRAVAVRGEMPAAELPGFFKDAFVASAAALEEAGAESTGPPFGYYPVTATDNAVIVEAGFPVSETVGLSGDVHDLVLPAGQAVIAWHIGPYETMVKTYEALRTWMAESNLEPAAGMWECYLSDPAVEPDPSKWRTKIIWPVTGS